MPVANVEINLLLLASDDDSFVVYLTDGRAVEVYNDGTVELWSPEDLLHSVTLTEG